MSKILVERPRPPSRVPRGRDGRRFRDQSDAAFLPMKAGYRDPKSLNENLRPLARYLERQVGRPWDKVYSEVRAVIDSRNPVQRHILEHLGHYVAVHTRVVDGDLIDLGKQFLGLRRVWQPLYVHPRTGLLRRNPDELSWRRTYRERERAKDRERAQVWREVSASRQLHRVNGCWFEVEIAPLPPPPDTRWDALRRRRVNARASEALRRLDDQSTIDLYGRPGVYAVSKRQLGAREIRACGLQAASILGSGPNFN
ncbi:MAG: hypothetical protein WBE92_01170 [Steroidobacteraceae bacterium]